MATLKDVNVIINVDTSQMERALIRVRKAMEDVSNSAIEIEVKQATKKRWWQFWK